MNHGNTIAPAPNHPVSVAAAKYPAEPTRENFRAYRTAVQIAQAGNVTSIWDAMK